MLNLYFASADVRWITGENDLPIAHIENEHAKATVSLYGGQLLTWQPHDEAPILWLSEQTDYQEGKAIRGGVPIIWPWFGAHPTDSDKGAHGVARSRMWRMVRVKQVEGGDTLIQMSLTDDTDTLHVWPHPFRLDVVYTIGRTLTTTLTAFNTGDQPFTMGGALHTYFTVGNTPDVTVAGLADVRYDDKVHGGVHKQKDAVTFTEEVDRVYLKTSDTVTINDPTLQREIMIDKHKSNTTVVWNPGTTAQKADLAADAWSQFVCVEAAKHGEDTVEVLPRKHFSLSQIVQLQRD